MMIWRSVTSVVLFSVSTQLGAQEWQGTESTGSYRAEIEQEGSTLSVTCSSSVENGQNSIMAILSGQAVTGLVQFQFNDGSQQSAILESGEVRADTQNNVELFEGIISKLKSQSSVTVRTAGGIEQVFSLRGSTRSIGDCPLPLAPFDISTCMTERGFGFVSYNYGLDPIALSDFCFDRSNGSFNGLVSDNNLTLVADSGTSFTYEDLASGGSSRPTLMISPVISATYHGGLIDDQSPEFYYGGNGASVTGYLYNQLATPETLGTGFGANVSTELFSLYGEASFINGTATFNLIDRHDTTRSRNGTGTLTIIVADDGSVSGSGNFSAENTRLAGYRQNEWVSATYQVTELRGYAVGETGQVIKTYATLAGQITDAEGDLREVVASKAEIFLYGSALDTNNYDLEIANTPADTVTPEQILAKLDGRVWSGTVFQDPYSYLTLIEKTNNVMTIQYPTVGCRGELELVEVESNRATYFETIVEGECITGGTITLSYRSDDSFQYEWRGALTGEICCRGVLEANE